jgi:hypothetical protein
MAWVDVPHNHIHFGLFAANPATASVSVAAADLLLFRYKILSADTVVIDFKIGKAFLTPTSAATSGITMELKVPFESVYVPAAGSLSMFMDGGQTFSNDCVIAFDPGSVAHQAGCVTVVNEPNHKVVLLVRTVRGDNINANNPGVLGFFGQITFEIVHKG